MTKFRFSVVGRLFSDRLLEREFINIIATLPYYNVNQWPRMTKQMDNMKSNISLLVLIALVSIDALAMPRITIKHDINNLGLARVQVMNETQRTLACYVAIDGHKIKFKLTARQNSLWYKATDVRFDHTHFSTWCDYIELYPEYH